MEWLIWYGLVSLVLLALFIKEFGPKRTDIGFFGWKKSLAILGLEILACPVFPIAVIAIGLYLIGFAVFQHFMEGKRKK